MPSIRRTPLNEFNRSQALFSLAFPTLYPYGQADFVEPRLRSITYQDYLEHAMHTQDGRFARHPTWRFVAFNTLMRRQARSHSGFFAVQQSKLGGRELTHEDVREAFNNPDSDEAQRLITSIARHSVQLRGTRPFWNRRRQDLEAHAHNLRCPGAFLTFSPADLHWSSLYQHMPGFVEWSEAPEPQRMAISARLLRENPHIAAWHFHRRFTLFRDIVLKSKFNLTDYWTRYEWQKRGSPHSHGLYWMKGAPLADVDNEDARREFARLWGFHVTAVNPEPGRMRPAGEGDPLAVQPLTRQPDFQWLSEVVNRVQRHRCNSIYCLRKKKNPVTGNVTADTEAECRFFFPRSHRECAELVCREGTSYYVFEAARNDDLMNQFNPTLLLGWLANIDISPCTSLQAVINYAGKYCSKAEKKSQSYLELAASVLPAISHRQPLVSLASKVMNKLISERDYSAQEIAHLLLNIPLQESTRVVVPADCRPLDRQDSLIQLNDIELRNFANKYRKYLSRSQEMHKDITFFEFLKYWNHKKEDSRSWTKWSSRAKPRVISYFPRYKPIASDPDQFEQFCRVKLTLNHAHSAPDELFIVDGQHFGSYTDAFQRCLQVHNHPDDAYGSPDVPDPQAEEDEFQDEIHNLSLQEEDWHELAQQLPDHPLSQEDLDMLGRRDIDINYSWVLHVGQYTDDGILQGDYWERLRSESSHGNLDVDNVPLSARDTLNREQRVVYDTVMGHFQRRIQEPLLLHVDGGGGTGKSYLIKVLSSHLQQSVPPGISSPIWRAAPTGVASNQISGTTLHSLLRLPIDTAWADLSPTHLGNIQKMLRGVQYLVIDEKSMLGLRTLGWIDHRLRQVFPRRNAEFFGGMSLILVGDFFQLPPVMQKPLYYNQNLKDVMELSGQNAYNQFSRSVFLKKVQRQQGEDQAAFRRALEEVRLLRLSRKQAGKQSVSIHREPQLNGLPAVHRVLRWN